MKTILNPLKISVLLLELIEVFKKLFPSLKTQCDIISRDLELFAKAISYKVKD